MRALLDTHAFLWWAMDEARLSAMARRILGDSSNTLLLSVASAWEIVIKVQAGRLKLPLRPGHYITERTSYYAIESLPIVLSHALQVEALPNLHRDPFDRMLVAQSRVERLPILTADPQIRAYKVETIW
ncbi:MAG: type II toxin-antitoxin system VapC family toxin [Acidobacteria bacterium]|nr:type II toxin-antitoxin system VapC family toxin [Acidobacteriota bacterium]